MTDHSHDWTPVEPGHVIPAGQPYMVKEKYNRPDVKIWSAGQSCDMRIIGRDGQEWFVDSSWRPPLELPTEPTWGIVVYNYQAYRVSYFGRWKLMGPTDSERNQLVSHYSGRDHTLLVAGIVDFIECTPDQVARIEGRHESE